MCHGGSITLQCEVELQVPRAVSATVGRLPHIEGPPQHGHLRRCQLEAVRIPVAAECEEEAYLKADLEHIDAECKSRSADL